MEDPTPDAVCESCGRTDERTEPVHRMLIVPDTALDDPVGRADPEVERWCASCRESYPNLPAGD